MAECLVKDEYMGIDNGLEAYDFIDYNTIRALPYILV